MAFFETLRRGLSKTRNHIAGGIENVMGAYSQVDDDFYEGLEEALILADTGVETAERIVENLRRKAREQRLKEPEQVRELLRQEIAQILESENSAVLAPGTMNILLVIGVNGAGKTTTIGKMASQMKAEGHKVLLAAADTFRAAAIDQLQVWADRAQVGFVCREEGSDPGAVVYDAAAAARSQKADVLICDTAGRLHNKKNLMEELGKLNRILDREFPQAHKEVLLVLDATTGQNALMQARLFSETVPITGIILTKLDGTAKGGVVLGIMDELKIPVKYIGVGEGIDDLLPFRAEDFAQALF